MKKIAIECQKLPPSAGIAIGPILFVIALLAVLAAVMASGGSDFQVASGADRITADLVAQANLIRNTINQCNMQYSLSMSENPGMTPVNADPPGPYPSSANSGTAVSALVCDPLAAAPSIWNSTTSTILLPPPTQGFNPWTYINMGSSGGRCFWTTPTSANPSASEVITGGLTHAATKFNSSTSYSATSEVIYDPNGTNNPNQKFVVWITIPSGAPDAHCVFP